MTDSTTGGAAMTDSDPRDIAGRLTEGERALLDMAQAISRTALDVEQTKRHVTFNDLRFIPQLADAVPGLLDEIARLREACQGFSDDADRLAAELTGVEKERDEVADELAHAYRDSCGCLAGGTGHAEGSPECLSPRPVENDRAGSAKKEVPSVPHDIRLRATVTPGAAHPNNAEPRPRALTSHGQKDRRISA